MLDLIPILLARNLALFGERDAVRRRAAIADLFTGDCVFLEPHGRHVGWEALDRAVKALQDQNPGFVFTALGPADALQGGGRLAWGFGPQGQPPRVTGLDVIVVCDSRIAALYTFLDPPTPEAAIAHATRDP